MNPGEMRYTRDHEWIAPEGNGQATVGITDHAQAALGDITFVELPPPGRRVKAGEPLAVVESVKAAADVYAPAAGVVTAVNEALDKHPELVNQEPFGKGWLCKLGEVEESALEALMTAEQYAAFRAAEA